MIKKEPHPGGRPMKIKTVEEMQRRIDDYFERAKGRLLYDKDGHPVADKDGYAVFTGGYPPTVTGLALHLGLSSRMALLHYQGREQFSYTITRAKSRIERYAEERLYDKGATYGAQFTLMNNFGWNVRSRNDDLSDLEVNITVLHKEPPKKEREIDE